MARVSQIGYLVLSVSDLAAWEQFATGILGLQVNGNTADGGLYLRMDDYHHRFIVRHGPDDDLQAIGWQVADEEALVEMEHKLVQAGIDITHGTAQELEERRVLGMIKFVDPNDIRTELYYAPLINRETSFSSPRHLSGFVAGDQGFGHITMAVNSLHDTLRFYREVLGMRMSDWVQPQPTRDVKSRFNIAFLHCNQRHHSLAFWQAAMPKRLHHFMLQLNSVEDVCSAYDLCQEREVPIELTLGRHTNDRMLSFYVRSPSGFSVEYGWGAREVDDGNWQVQLHRTGSSWGHRLIKR